MQASLRTVVAVAFCATALAGCADERPAPMDDPTPTPTAAWSFRDGIVALEQCRYANCYEPIAVQS